MEYIITLAVILSVYIKGCLSQCQFYFKFILYVILGPRAYLLIIPRVNTGHGKAGFSYHAPNSWNKLPEDLRLPTTLTTFETRLNTLMFALAFC